MSNNVICTAARYKYGLRFILKHVRNSGSVDTWHALRVSTCIPHCNSSSLHFAASDMETDGEELTLLEYTRYYGLSCDSAHESDDETESCFYDYIKSPSHTLCAATDETETIKIGLLDEKVMLDAAARTVLSSVYSLQKKPATFSIELDVRQTKQFRLEEPMLFTDVEIDVKHYRAARFEDETDKDAIDWQSFTFKDQEEQDQDRPDTLLQKFTESVKKEKLEVPREAILLLKQACAPQEVEKDRIESYELGLKYRRVCLVVHCLVLG